MQKTRTLIIATVAVVAFAGQASAGGLLGLGILGNKTGGIVVAPNVGVGVGNILSDNKGNNTNVLNGVLSGNLSGILNGVGILNSSSKDSGDCGCKKRRR